VEDSFLKGEMGVDMNEVVMLRGAEPREILETAIAEKVPAIMSYLSKDKWHIAKVILTNLGANKLSVEIWPKDRDPILQKDRKMGARKMEPPQKHGLFKEFPNR